MSERHLAKGQELPPLEKGKLRLYSMVFCPFAQRTRLVLAHKNIPHETVNVNLKRKPGWFLERNPLGMVPTLEQDGQIVYESAIVDEYLDEVYPGNKLSPQDPYEKARQKLLMEAFSKVPRSFMKAFRANGEERAELMERLRKQLDFYENTLKSNFFGGENVGMADFHFWPWFERFEAIHEMGYQLLDTDRYPTLNAWTKRMYEVPAVKATVIIPRDHMAFFISYSGGEPNYDALVKGSKI